MVTRRRRRLLWIAGAAVVVVVLAAVAGPYVYIHFIEGPAPPKLALPNGHDTTSSGAHADPGSSAASGSVSGTWNVGAGSVAGYRVQEVLIGQNATAVGRTEKIWGSLSVVGTTVTDATFHVNMASVVSDQSQRNARFDGPIMDVREFPTATLQLTAPIELGAVPLAATVSHYQATGILSLHGITKTVSFPVSAERVGTEIDVLADITIPFSEWGIANPSIGGFVTTANQGTLEVLLHLTQGAGNPPSTSPGASTPAPGGGPVTIPSTTLPPLKVPSG